jgi:hypothetical protein
MERLAEWANTHPWSYIVLFPVLVPYMIWKVLKAFAEWGQS